MNKIKKEILYLSPDVFCLQEADIYILKNYLMKSDMNKYEILYGINCGSSFINIIGYKKEKYMLKSFKNFSLANLGKYAGNRGIMNINLELIDNNNDKIKKNKSQKKIISIYNVHFPWKYENDRISLLNMIFKHIKDNFNEDENKKVLIVGDFNSEPSSKLIKLFYYKKFLKDEAKNNNNEIINQKEKKTKIDLNTLYLCEDIYNKFHFNSAYQCYSKEKIINGEFMRHPSFTSRTKYFKKTIDYIFFSNNLKIRKILKLPHDYEVDKEKFLPSKEFPSDHIKLFAEFEI
jgi:mRNA deadenylase 3'-5' endonuclease subunit Ccr4